MAGSTIQCQKQDWPAHKLSCKVLTPECYKVEKILSFISSNPYLRLEFEIMAILLFKMHLMIPSSLAKFHEKPFEMDVFLQQEPADIEDFFRLYRRGSIYDTKGSIFGMPQIVNVVPKSSMTPQDMQRWKDEVAENESSVSSPAISAEDTSATLNASNVVGIIDYDRPVVGFIRFKHRMPAGEHFRMASLSSCVTITPKAMGITKELKTVTIEHELAGAPLNYTRPTSLDAFIELINAQIRRDTTDAWCLRMELPDYGRGMLALGAPPYDASWLDGVFTRVTREKVRRELIYSAAGQYYGYNVEGMSKVEFIDGVTGEGGGKEVIDSYQAEYSDDSSTGVLSSDPSPSQSRSTRKKKRHIRINLDVSDRGN